MVDMLALVGHPRNVPIEELELMWVLGCYPEQLKLVLGSQSEVNNIHDLRKAVNKAVHLTTGSDPAGASHDSFEGTAPLTEWTVDNLHKLGLRSIDLIELRSTIKAASKLLKPRSRKVLHCSLIMAGVGSPEDLHQELLAQTISKLP